MSEYVAFDSHKHYALAERQDVGTGRAVQDCRTRTVVSLFGPVHLTRAPCPSPEGWSHPLDRTLRLLDIGAARRRRRRRREPEKELLDAIGEEHTPSKQADQKNRRRRLRPKESAYEFRFAVFGVNWDNS
jgi:hypothetical protein